MKNMEKIQSVKIFVALFSVFLVLCGVSYIALGSYAEGIRLGYMSVISVPGWPSQVVILFGVFVLLCPASLTVGTYWNVSYLRKLFVGWLILIVSMEVSIGIVCCVYYSQSDSQNLSDRLTFDAENSWDANHSEPFINKLQSEFRCCGLDSFLDWPQTEDCENGSVGVNCTIPASCCSGVQAVCFYTYMSQSEASLGNDIPPINHTQAVSYGGNVYAEGCKSSLTRWLDEVINALGLTSLLLTLPQVACAVALHWFMRETKLNSLLYEYE